MSILWSVVGACLVWQCAAFAAEVTYGGISIDTQGRALTRDKSNILGLLVGGVDAGGFSNLGYAGGLALAFCD